MTLQNTGQWQQGMGGYLRWRSSHRLGVARMSAAFLASDLMTSAGVLSAAAAAWFRVRILEGAVAEGLGEAQGHRGRLDPVARGPHLHRPRE